MSSLPSHFVPDQPGRLTKRSFQSPYSYRASGLAQIAVSALLRANSIGARDILAAEHCRYGTRDLALIENGETDYFRIANYRSTSRVTCRKPAVPASEPVCAQHCLIQLTIDLI